MSSPHVAYLLVLSGAAQIMFFIITSRKALFQTGVRKRRGSGLFHIKVSCARRLRSAWADAMITAAMVVARARGAAADSPRRYSGTASFAARVRTSHMDRYGPCKSLKLGDFVDREVGAIWWWR